MPVTDLCDSGSYRLPVVERASLARGVPRNPPPPPWFARLSPPWVLSRIPHTAAPVCPAFAGQLILQASSGPNLAPKTRPIDLAQRVMPVVGWRLLQRMVAVHDKKGAEGAFLSLGSVSGVRPVVSELPNTQQVRLGSPSKLPNPMSQGSSLPPQIWWSVGTSPILFRCADLPAKSPS